jgi:hypothetical protein
MKVLEQGSLYTFLLVSRSFGRMEGQEGTEGGLNVHEGLILRLCEAKQRAKAQDHKYTPQRA